MSIQLWDNYIVYAYNIDKELYIDTKVHNDETDIPEHVAKIAAKRIATLRIFITDQVVELHQHVVQNGTDVSL